MSGVVPQREDQRRTWALWVLVCADMTQVAPKQALDTFERAFVEEATTPSAREATEYFRIERFEDHLPTPEGWAELRPRVAALIEAFGNSAAEIDAIIVKASPRWRLDRMPMIDRNLLRVGVTELAFLGKPRARATINGAIELGKRLGSETTPSFVNGILDQIRRDLGVPFG